MYIRFFIPFGINAQRISNIPDSVFSYQQKEILTTQKIGLTERVTSFKVHKINFETRCKGVETNTSLDAACKIEQKEIENKRDSLINDINKFNDLLIVRQVKQLAKTFNVEKNTLTSYISQNHTDFSNEEDVNKLLTFLKKK